jgi:WD40 repeat protein/serine/threonine protein kinase
MDPAFTDPASKGLTMTRPKRDEAEIFDRARQIEAPDARRLFLEEACGEDRHLQARVQALLRVYEEERGFLESPILGSARVRQVAVKESLVGAQIGPYKLVEQIGEGGFGIVFLAAQQQPVRRQVALKIIKPGMDTRQVVARFEAERQALALMDHPHIAKVLDAGTTGDLPNPSLPYFVMELVKGIPITRYCDEQQLTPRQRLALILPVCQAVQHAHQKGIIHRDLKPSNVLIASYDGVPVPKVIDFGVAKALGQELTDRTLMTGFGGIVGTLEYMSPEQAEFNARDIDTRADIYSLGVLLYELLTGTTPLTKQRLKEAGMSEALRLIRDEEPPTPSTRLSACKDGLASISAQRKLDPARLTREVRGELDWIVMKAVEKDRSRRYQTANGLARDLERYLHDEPVEACPPSTSYRLRKFARKNRKLLGVATAFALLLISATLVSLGQAIRATQAEHATGQEKDRAEAETRRAHRNLYDAHMRLAQSDWEEARVKRVVELLEEHQPLPGEEDLRGFEWYYLKRLTDTALRTLKGHRGQVWSVAFGPEGKRLASAGDDCKIRMWDLATGQEISVFDGHAQPVVSVAFSPNGKRLASGSSDGTVKLWDPASGQEVQTLKGHTNRVVSVAFSPGGRQLASACQDGTVKLWDTASGRPLRTLTAHSRFVTCVAFGPDGKTLATAGADKLLKLWHTATGQEIRSLEGHTDEVSSVAFSPDGKQLVSAGLDRTVRLWDLVRHQLTRTMWGHTGRVFAVTFSPDGARLASASADQTIKIWNPTSGEPLTSLKGHTSRVAGVAFSPDGWYLASASHDGTVRIWDATETEGTAIVRRERDLPKSVAFSPEGNRLASAGHDPRIAIWDAASGRETLILSGHRRQVLGVVFSPDGTRLASASEDRTVRVWDAVHGRELLRLPGPTAGFLNPGSRVAFSPDGERLAGASADTTVKLWDAGNGHELLTLHGHMGAVTSVAFGPLPRGSASGIHASGLLASAGVDRSIKVWDAVNGRLILTLLGHDDVVNCVTFSPDGSRLASASRDMTVRVWDLESGQEKMTLTGHTFAVYCVAFSPDGTRLATSSADRMVKVWDMASGQETLNLRGHVDGVPSVAFSPDGMRLASAGYDRTLRVWDARPWTPQLRLEKEARDLVGHFYAQSGLNADVIQSIEQDPTLGPALRQKALAMTQRWREDPSQLNNLSWDVVVRRTATTGEYALALRQARVACSLEPDNGFYVNTLGVALYRCGQFEEALKTLARSDEINSASPSGRRPEDIAFLAMTHFKLGRQEKAQALLADLRRLMKRPASSSKAEAQGLLLEAAELIERKREHP